MQVIARSNFYAMNVYRFVDRDKLFKKHTYG